MTVLKIECMYCNKDMGKKDGEGVSGVTTSICRECWIKNHPRFPYPEKEREVTIE